MDRPSSLGQAERSVNGNKVGLSVVYLVQDVFIAERNVRVRSPATKETHTCRTTQRTREVYADDNKRFAVRHNDSLTPPDRGQSDSELSRISRTRS